MQSSWIPLDKIQNILTTEGYIVSWLLLILGFLFYKIFLKKITEKRHNNLRARFNSAPLFLFVSTILTIVQFWMNDHLSDDHVLIRSAAYLALLALIIGAMSIIKISQIYVYLYLFFSNMSHGVPKLLANMFTFIFTLIIGNLIASSVFGIHITALLATSAVFSLVLGLALQDTLGNLFAGVSLQIESPFKIGDWIEVHSEKEKILGQVQEITWRATFMMSFADELIMIPNRTIAQSQIILISQGAKNVRLNQAFRFSYDVSIEKAKNAIREGIASVDGILTDPPIRILIVDTHPSFLEIKVFYSLVDFSTRYRTGDTIVTKVLDAINRNNLKIQSPKFELSKE
jgi:small-conductance mechanosensitive channel